MPMTEARNLVSSANLIKMSLRGRVSANWTRGRSIHVSQGRQILC
jgi:hypothetical protein